MLFKRHLSRSLQTTFSCDTDYSGPIFDAPAIAAPQFMFKPSVIDAPFKTNISGLLTMVIGAVIFLDWISGTGLIITVKGKTQGAPFKEWEFFKAIKAIWLGPNPAYWKLKDEMLGVK